MGPASEQEERCGGVFWQSRKQKRAVRVRALEFSENQRHETGEKGKQGKKMPVGSRKKET